MQPAPPLAMDKHWSTLRARAALKGIRLIPSTDERGCPEYIATWYALTKAFSSLDQVEAWLSRVEGSTP